jgi:putative membrane protein
MSALAQVFIVVSVLFHVFAFTVESLLFHRSAARSLLVGRQQPAEGVRLWALNQGFYNLFLAAGPVAGLVAYHGGEAEVGRALAVYGCAFMTACGLVLLGSNRRLWRGAVAQSAPPLVALVALLG